MKKKKEEFFYKNLCACVEVAGEAASMLKETVQEYDESRLQEKLDAMHELEQKGDAKHHKMMSALSRAFITPIEREDLVALSNYLDDITDAVEDVMLELYMSGVKTIRRDMIPMLELLIEGLQALGNVMKELKDLKHSKKMNGYIIRVNELEEKGDKLFVENMHDLYQETDLKTILVWRKIYEGIENCMDCCEHTADVAAMVCMKNS